MDGNDIYNIITAILFAAGDAVSLKSIAAAAGQSESAARQLIAQLSDKLKNENSGVLIIEINDAYQMTTNPVYYPYIELANKLPKPKTLTAAQLETLAVIAYKQPVCKADIERVRGVDATHTVNKLIEYELVTEAGRAQTPGRPILFTTTDKFLARFGFSRLTELPGIYGTIEEVN